MNLDGMDLGDIAERRKEAAGTHNSLQRRLKSHRLDADTRSKLIAELAAVDLDEDQLADQDAKLRAIRAAAAAARRTWANRPQQYTEVRSEHGQP